MMQPRLGATWAYDGRNTVFVSYAKYNPAASSLPRAASWDRNVANHDQWLLRRERQPLRHRPPGLVVGQALRARHDAAHDQGSAVRHGPAVRRSLDRAPLRPVPERQPLLGRHEQHRAAGLQPAARYPEGPVHPQPERSARADRERIDAMSSPISTTSFTKYYEATVESEYHGGQAFFRGSYTWSHYYGNFDQDGSSSDQRLEHLHRVVEHRRRRRPSAVGHEDR